MLKNHKPFPLTRPYSRLQNMRPNENKIRLTGMHKCEARIQGNFLNKQKVTKSPTKQNERPRANFKKEKTLKAAPVNKIQLPAIKIRKVLSQEQRNHIKQSEDFETYCSKGHTVFVDQRDAGVKLGHLKQNSEQKHRKAVQQKGLLGETAYVPFNIQALKKKVEEKLNTSTSTWFEQSH